MSGGSGDARRLRVIRRVGELSELGGVPQRIADVKTALAKRGLDPVYLGQRRLPVPAAPWRRHVQLAARHGEYIDVGEPDGTHPHAFAGQSRTVLAALELASQPAQRGGDLLDRDGGRHWWAALVGDLAALVPYCSGTTAAGDQHRRSAKDHQ